MPELGNQARLFILGEGACDLAHHLPRRVAASPQVVALGRQHPHPSADQKGDAELLGHQLAGEASCVLDDDSTDAIPLDPI